MTKETDVIEYCFSAIQLDFALGKPAVENMARIVTLLSLAGYDSFIVHADGRLAHLTSIHCIEVLCSEIDFTGVEGIDIDSEEMGLFAVVYIRKKD